MAKLLTGTRIYGTGTVDTQLFVSGTNSATSTVTGALQVVGGVGIGGNIAIGGALYAGGTTGTNGQVLTSNGNGISWTTLSSSFNGGTITSPLIINNSTGASSTTTGALQIVTGGVGVGGGLVVGGISTITNTTAASSTNTGALQVRGGMGIGGNLYAGLDGYFNGTRVGRGAGSIITNTALGNGALDTNTTGTNNIAVGYLSLNSNQTGANNVALGYETMFGTTNAFADTALGARALQNISSGQYNIGIGYNAGNSITTENSNTIIGSVSGSVGMTGTVIIAAGTTERIRVDSSNLYINGSIFTGGGGSSVFTFGGTGTPTTGTALTPYLRVMTAGTSVASSLVAKTAPSGSSFVVSILRSSNNGSTFPDTITTLTLTSGNQVTTASPTTSLAVGDLLRLDISSVNGASDWTAQLKVT